MRISDVIAPKPLTKANGFYLVHIRKTAGTSLNHMFLSLGEKDHESFHKALADKPDHTLERQGRVFVGWDENILNRGGYFYGFSHAPLYRLNLPPQAFAFTVFRDPVQRVVSHYNMLMGLHVNAIAHPCMTEEGPWIAQGFETFLDRIPPFHLMNQLGMFSPHFSVPEALHQLKTLGHFFFTEKFAEGVASLNRKTGLNLEPLRERVSSHKAFIAKPLLEKLRQKLEPEYQFLQRAKDLVQERELIPDWLR
jgi:Sulfotransferase family